MDACTELLCHAQYDYTLAEEYKSGLSMKFKARIPRLFNDLYVHDYTHCPMLSIHLPLVYTTFLYQRIACLSVILKAYKSTLLIKVFTHVQLFAYLNELDSS